MSYQHKFGVNASTGGVELIRFEVEYESDGVKVKCNRSWEVDEKTVRPENWTSQMVDIEYAKCDSSVHFTNLLKKLHSRKLARRTNVGVVQVFQQ